jgi:hypothetical protein
MAVGAGDKEGTEAFRTDEMDWAKQLGGFGGDLPLEAIV